MKKYIAFLLLFLSGYLGFIFYATSKQDFSIVAPKSSNIPLAETTDSPQIILEEAGETQLFPPNQQLSDAQQPSTPTSTEALALVPFLTLNQMEKATSVEEADQKLTDSQHAHAAAIPVQDAKTTAPQSQTTAAQAPAKPLEEAVTTPEKPAAETPSLPPPAPAPTVKEENKGPEIKESTFEESGLVDIEKLPITVFMNIKYATADNFTGKTLYNSPSCYLKKPAADGLVRAAKYARESKNPFYFCIYDCYRPPSVQHDLWEVMPKKGLVANPYTTGSNHSRGMAVDVGPCNEYGQPMEMPTDFDEFSPKAYSNAVDDISDEALQNRDSLQDVMTRAGFSTINKEWWHFDYKGYRNHPLIKLKHKEQI